ncbi:sensor histidine kinase [Lyticum sinuosum]|uniref:sensor histidine kinase n=1 Tax=Lyticum sinuosum TaxID=1332059 RepID=UPI002ACDF9E7|nr:HAMP domain-containing sensor histidine kinase [Lyticum sinuosum]
MSQQQVNRDGSQRYTFAVFSMLNYVAPMFIVNIMVTLNDVLIILRIIAIMLCFGLCTVDYWPRKIRDICYPLYWYMTLWFCLPFLSSYTAFITRAEECWLLNAALSLLLLIMLVSWLVFVILMVSGISFAYTIYYIKLSSFPPIQLPSNNIYPFAYLCAFLLLSIILFMRHKEDVQIERIEMLQLFSGAIAHEVNSPLAAIRMLSNTYNEISKVISAKDKSLINEDGEIVHNIIINDSDYKMMLEILPQNFNRTALEASKVVEILLFSLRNDMLENNNFWKISEVIEEAIDGYGFTQEQRLRVVYDTSDDFFFAGSKQLVKHILYNLIRNTIKYSGSEAKISIWLENNHLHFRDNGIGIEPKELSKIFKLYYTSNRNIGTGIGLAFCDSVMKSMGGSIKCKSEYGSFSEFILKFPEED